MNLIIKEDTIVALSTPAGIGAIGVIRMSGAEAFNICSQVFESKKGTKNLSDVNSHSIHFGVLKDNETIVDEILLSVFKAPNSYTGEDTIEVSCHGSPFIQQQILKLFIKKGAAQAKAGEFTMRAYLNGKLDLSQAEAVADLIASDSEASHQIAMHQMRGGFSKEINDLREQLINFASLIELELDFSEEDVEFANRQELVSLIQKIQKVILRLTESFEVGNVIKNGIPVAIVGEPNVGKSTLLNVLLNEEKAIVSDIAGTTRDAIEDEIIINGISFRFIDTAGIRETTDTIESLGIIKTFEKIDQAAIILYLFDSVDDSLEKIKTVTENIKKRISGKRKMLLLLANKTDKGNSEEIGKKLSGFEDVLFISAKKKENIELLKDRLASFVNTGALKNNQTIVSNIRHYEALSKAGESLDQALTGINSGVTGDFIAMDIRRSLQFLGSITGAIGTDDLLENIFSKFCIGK